VAIEDKVYTNEHSNQLERYKQIINDEYKNTEIQTCLVYLKTGNESLSKWKTINEKGWKVINRNDILNVLNKHTVNNDIFNDFLEHLKWIENLTNSWRRLGRITESWHASQGFYINLQKHIDYDWTDWGDVNHRAGGFLCFWYYEKRTSEIKKIHIQIENTFEHGIKLVIKISDYSKNIQTLKRCFDEFLLIAKQNEITITKPKRFKPAKSSTIAVVENAFRYDEASDFDFNHFLFTLKKVEKIIDSYCKSHSE